MSERFLIRPDVDPGDATAVQELAKDITSWIIAQRERIQRQSRQGEARMKINPMVQLKELLALDVSVQFEGYPGAYEVTLYDQMPREDGMRNHSHYQGATLEEAINRALKSSLDKRHQSG